MKDIFISYSRKDSATAEKFQKLLTEEGWSVFWDVEILPGKAWSDQLEQKLLDCKCIVVLWSEHSLQSDYVKEEAALGKSAKKLVPIMIGEGIHPPFGFGMLEAAMLSDWDGDKNNREYQNLIKAISELVPPNKKRATENVVPHTKETHTKTATISVSKTKTTPSTSSTTNNEKSKTPLIAGSILGLLAILGAFFFFNKSTPAPIPKKPITELEKEPLIPKKEDTPTLKSNDPVDTPKPTDKPTSGGSQIDRLKASINDAFMESKKIIDQELQDVGNNKKKIAAPGKFTTLKNKRTELDTRMKRWVADGSTNLGQLKAIEYDSQRYLATLKRTRADIFQVADNINSDAKRLINQLKNSAVMGALIAQCNKEFDKDLENKGIFQAIWMFNEIAKNNPDALRPHKQTLFEFFDKGMKVYKAGTQGQMNSIRRNLG